jgi:hypothetical protein
MNTASVGGATRCAISACFDLDQWLNLVEWFWNQIHRYVLGGFPGTNAHLEVDVTLARRKHRVRQESQVPIREAHGRHLSRHHDRWREYTRRFGSGPRVRGHMNVARIGGQGARPPMQLHH